MIQYLRRPTENKRHLAPNTLKYTIYHGIASKLDPSQLHEIDVVLTTYETLVSRMTYRNWAFSDCTWFRIILDEAHIIRNPSTQVFQLMHRLHAQRRWAVSATPVQNSLQDLFSIVKFLRIRPFDDDVIARRHILQPLHEKDRRGLDNLGLLMKSFSLRRTKDTCSMPSKREIQVTIDFSSSERQVYNAIIEQGRRRLFGISRTRIHETGRMIFQITNHLRQLCSYGFSNRCGSAVLEQTHSSKLYRLVFHILELDHSAPSIKPKKRYGLYKYVKRIYSQW